MAAKSKFGYMKCPDCAERVVVKTNDKGTLSYSCDECDSSGYAKKDAGNYAKWVARIERTAPAAAAATAPSGGSATKEEKPAAAKPGGGILDDII